MKVRKSKLSFILIWAAGVVVIAAVLTGCEKDQTEQAEKIEYALEKTFERGPLTVHVKVEKEEITIADTVRVRFDAISDETYEVEMPTMAAFLAGEENWGILDYTSLPDRLLQDDKILRSKLARLEPVVSGTYNIPALPFIFYKKSEKDAPADPCLPPAFGARPEETFELVTEAVPVEVISLIDEEQADLDISGIKDVAAPEETNRAGWYILIGAGTILITAAIIVFILIRRKQTPQETKILVSAHELAYQRLRKLAEENLIEQDRVKEFYERISTILRWYIEHRFRLRAPERTTEEFLNEMRQTDVLNLDQQRMLSEFLTHCDLVKFARYGPTEQEIQHTFDLTKNFIEATRITEKQVDVTGQVRQHHDEAARSA